MLAYTLALAKEKPTRFSRQVKSRQMKNQMTFKVSSCRMGKPHLYHYSETAGTVIEERPGASQV